MPKIVILTGAGISKESGLDTFRDTDGLWSKVRLEDVATPEGFIRNPQMVQDFYNARRQQLNAGDINPNPAHFALAELEAKMPGQVLIVTQNIDNLHEKAGSRNILHMHGELNKIRCSLCDDVNEWLKDVTPDLTCPNCRSQNSQRPHVVWFGEMPLFMDEIYEALSECELFVSIGTSGNVYPAAGFVSHVRMQGKAKTVELNLEPSQGANLFAQKIHGPASLVVPQFVASLL